MNFASQKYLKLDPKLFKAFMAVAEYGSYATAAKKSAQSPSVVSDHMIKIRETLGHDVVIKVSDTYKLTSAGKMLQQYIRRIMDVTAEFHDGLDQGQESMEGMVRYAMPPSCLQSPHFPMLLQRRLDFPGIALQVELCPTEAVTQSVIDDRFDFGFVTERIEHPSLRYIPFCEEEYVLVSSSRSTLDELQPDTVMDHRFINYPGMDVCFDLWARHFMTEAKTLTARSLYHTGDINDIVGAIKMVIGGLGISVFPRHCVEAYLENGELVEYDKGDLPPMMNTIYITTRRDISQPRRVDTVIQWFRDMHPEFQEE
ncbi:LysR family transcriptional regulator [Aliamphritea hakodatensis]|uniref:LysR family transcriptional regulator n=1 Tax=Aliamphritea hakodatensis TaxID=2895352 RepID=UPI0022FDA246|nr:LysR family transcriptional regulator [Aliamphritea hakodatensis]